MRAASFSEAPRVGPVSVRIERFLQANPEVGEYVDSLSPDDKYPVRWSLTKTFEWLSKRLSLPLDGIVKTLLDRQEDANIGRGKLEKMRLEDQLVEFSKTQVIGTRSYKLRFYNLVHGLFNKHHVDLPTSDEVDKIRGDRPGVEGSLTPDEIRRTVEAAKLPEKVAFALMYQGFLDRARFVELNENAWPEIKRQLEDKTTKWVRVGFERRKMNEQPYYVKWHKEGDAVRFLRQYLKERGEPKPLGRDDRGRTRHEPIVLNKEGNGYSKNALSLQWTMAATRAGVIQRTVPTCPTCDLPMAKRKYGHGGYFEGHQGSWYVCLKCGLREKACDYRKQLETSRYGKNLHEMRDTLITILPTMAGVDGQLVEFFAGHQVDPLKYKKFKNLEDNWIEKEWSKARPYLDLWSNQSIASRERLEEENRQLKEDLERVKVRQDRMEAAFWLGQAARVQRGISVLNATAPNDPLLGLTDTQIIDILKQRKAALTNQLAELEEDNTEPDSNMSMEAPVAPSVAADEARKRETFQGTR